MKVLGFLVRRKREMQSTRTLLARHAAFIWWIHAWARVVVHNHPVQVPPDRGALSVWRAEEGTRHKPREVMRGSAASPSLLRRACCVCYMAFVRPSYPVLLLVRYDYDN